MGDDHRLRNIQLPHNTCTQRHDMMELINARHQSPVYSRVAPPLPTPNVIMKDYLWSTGSSCHDNQGKYTGKLVTIRSKGLLKYVAHP